MVDTVLLMNGEGEVDVALMMNGLWPRGAMMMIMLG